MAELGFYLALRCPADCVMGCDSNHIVTSIILPGKKIDPVDLKRIHLFCLVPVYIFTGYTPWKMLSSPVKKLDLVS